MNDIASDRTRWYNSGRYLELPNDVKRAKYDDVNSFTAVAERYRCGET